MADEEPKNDETPVAETADETASEAVASDAAAESEAVTEAEVAPEAAAAEDVPAEKPKRATRAKAAPKADAKAAEEEAPAPKRRGPRPKPAAKAPEKKERGVYRRDPKVITVQGPRKERRGVVVSAKPDKTIIIRVDSAKPHPKYLKIVRRSVRLHAHDEQNEAGLGDTVRVIESRPLSKLKRWRLAEILERAK